MTCGRETGRNKGGFGQPGYKLLHVRWKRPRYAGLLVYGTRTGGILQRGWDDGRLSEGSKNHSCKGGPATGDGVIASEASYSLLQNRLGKSQWFWEGYATQDQSVYMERKGPSPAAVMPLEVCGRFSWKRVGEAGTLPTLGL